ncbi:DUF6318 domain-containing protein [Occultella aeris]|uniref:DUF6318 domain-containing protein n=1 Tax=Occultella aeris TaxID=2761496 RepID=A0A7M4DNG3_9MICO|nr:DUF6318 family protein [Occultella aeris]VZO38976.1 hypothetical protein HALOF300_03693 [Occultella aeris]
MTRGSWRGRRRQWYVPTAALALVMLVAGCDGGDPVEPPTSVTESSEEPTTEEPTTEEPTTAEPTEFPSPERPAAMDESGPDGAIAAARYFFELVTYSQNTADTSQLQEVSDPECDFCLGVLRVVSLMVEDEAEFSGGEYDLDEESVQVDNIDDTYTVTFDLNQGGGVARYPDGREEELPPGEYSGVVLTALFNESSWLVLDVVIPGATS